ncbi:hypothetical protein CHS0354_004383 [Potamilus streckersoni]|uniref:Nucleoporin NUP42 n=1 Tax=Potamilus streckersoni TaxID=2493646 RepID=A0AAE0SZT7_9BIVA|nr:hypothetical protein CHS0354_004383 [Potamilus streckersoni]
MLQVCHFFQATGKCRFGKHCRFKHIFKEGEALSAITLDCTTDSNLSVAEPESQTQSRSTIYSHTGIKENQDEELSGESFSDRPLCWAFSERGWCRFGQHCRYLHIKVRKPWVNRNRAGVEPHSLKENQDDIDPVQENLYPHESEKTSNKRKICKTFADRGSCRYGSRCQFLHFKLVKPEAFASQLENEEEKEEKISIKKGSFSESLEAPKQDNAESLLEKETAVSAKQTIPRRICRFIKSGKCKFGKSCKFYHPQDPLDIKNELPEERQTSAVDKTMEIIKEDKIEQDKMTDERYKVQQNLSEKHTPFKPQGFIPIYKRGEATTEQLMELREIEIKQLKKRFTRDTLAVTEESEERFTCRIAFSSSDPDWPFDVKVFDLELDFPTSYPEQLFSVTLPSDQNLPETVRRYIEVVIQEWLESKLQDLKARGVIELVLRSYLRWLDRNLEGVVTEALRQLKKDLAAKAAGLEFIPASQLKRKQKQSESEARSNDDNGTNGNQSTSNPCAVEKDVIIYRKMDVQEVYQVPGRNQKDLDETKEKMPTSEDGDWQKGVVSDADRKGTEVALKNLQLLDSAATLLFEKIYIIIQCERCSSKTEFSTPAGRVNSVVCVKCSNTMVAFFRSALVHQFSSVLGYLELQGCKAFDLVMQESALKLGCLNCSQEVTLKSIAPGILSEIWCHSCHDKMRVATDGVRFTNLAPAEMTLDASKVHQIAVQKKQRLPKDPAIQEGRPLPEYGTCKHFKKSFRWLRFPCCGKCYPCDVCHEEKEGDHEMKYATRMICGFCCKEQPYSSEKPCISCSHNIVKSRTVHWEGGKGCRDKISMSKNDKQKYTNMSKTTSNRAERLKKISKGQKNTKLRHN